MPPILRLEGVHKRYPGVVALDHVNFSVDPGEIRALLGKNGAGKSTLIKILSGAVQQDEGTIYIDEQPVTINNTRDAFARGIYTVYQEMSLVPELTVAENILLGHWPTSRWGVVNHREQERLARASLERLKVNIDLNTTISRLDVAQQQIVEIAKALIFDPRVLILDEPTSALAASEVRVLHQVVRQLAAEGHAVIYVTHRLQEIPLVADSVTILRDGKQIGTIPVAEATPERIVHMMIGFGWQRKKRGAHEQSFGPVKLEVRGLRREGVLHDVSFQVRAGEVVGIAGLMGSGRTELLRAIFGLDPVDDGEVRVEGAVITRPTPQMMKAHSVALTPEDRKRQGLILSASVQNNLTLSNLKRHSTFGVLSLAGLQAAARQMVKNVDIKTSGVDVEVQTLSGGNQQKVVIGNWLNNQPGVLIMDEPTRGIDVHAKEQIFELMRQLARQGLAVLFVSSEIEEVYDIADRILVMNHGRITHDVLGDDVSLEDLMTLVIEGAPQ